MKDVIRRIKKYFVAGKTAKHCTSWTGARCNGYPLIWNEGKLVRVSHVLWEDKYGPIEEGLYILHTCDNPPCLNFNHLYLGDLSRNRLDCMQRDRLPCAKLLVVQVREIRESFRSKPRPMSAHAFARIVAPVYGISRSAIRHIVGGRSWKGIV